MNGIKITYSWGDEESIIECAKDKAWREIVKLASKEVETETIESESNVDVFYNYAECEVVLHYQRDDEYCYYRYTENEKEERK